MSTPHYFGIRHHGPGSARSLVRAFEALRPDLVLVEGPPEAEALVAAVAADGMEPPVAILSYCPDAPALGVYHPFAVFSPEWQAMRWAVAHGVPVRFIDLPMTHVLAAQRDAREAARAAAVEVPPGEPDAEAVVPASTPDDAGTGPSAAPRRLDPLSWLALAAGYADGESWWNHMVEERGDGAELFAAIAEATVTLRAETGDGDDEEAQRDARREAHMRQCIRRAVQDGGERIAVVCGAWHLGGLLAATPVKSDTALLKGLPKVKVATTWVPWTYRHLARASGYGAGIASPGWYEHLWRTHLSGQPRAVGWLARVARLLRARDLDCSSAHLIEASRLAEALAALRDRPAPGLDELQQATRSVLTQGDDTVLRFIDNALVVGDRLGRVPADVPTVPLQRDLEQLQKSLRLKPEALQKSLDLDLRNATDLARSHLLHRLSLLDVPWGALARVGVRARGTFHEFWTLQWQPEFALRLIEASQWGQTVVAAATASVTERCRQIDRLDALSALVDRVLLADLDAAVAVVTRALDDRAAVTGDVGQLLAALPPLANAFRYGTVRQTDTAMVTHVLDGLIARAAIGLPLAACALDDAAADALRSQLLAGDAAVALRGGAEQTAAWQRALVGVAGHARAHELLQGLATRLLLDAGVWTSAEAARQLSRHLSIGAEPAKAAAWLEGFLNRNAVVLLHDPTVWRLVDEWVSGLGDEHFVRVLPLVRRAFSGFTSGERRDLAQHAAQDARPIEALVQGPSWDDELAALPLPLLRQILGVPA